MNNFDAWAREFVIRAALWEIAVAIVSVLVLYYVVKAAVRDGIKESGLIQSRDRSWQQAVREAQTYKTLPDMRAD